MWGSLRPGELHSCPPTPLYNMARRRYRLLPYLYTLFLSANATGGPIMRPLFYEFPEDPEVGGVDKEFLLGELRL